MSVVSFPSSSLGTRSSKLSFGALRFLHLIPCREPLSRTPVEIPCRDPLSRRTKGSGAESRSGASGVSVPKLELGNELPPNTMRKQKLKCFQTGFVLFYPTNDAIHIHFSKSALANWRCVVGRKNLRSLCSQTKARFGCECLARMRKCQQSH